MKKVCSYKAYSIRFRRWSRKGYAVFMSLHKAVTIGHVCRSIADAALSKNKSFSTGNRKQVTAFADAGETEEAQDAGGGVVFASGKVVSCPERYIPIYNKVSGMGKTRKRVSLVPLFCFVDECLLKRRFSQINADLFLIIISAKICVNLRFNLKTY